MADEDEIVVSIDTTGADGESSVTEDPAKILAQQYQDLKADNDRERERTRAAEQKALTAREEAEQARRETHVARVDVVESQCDVVATGLAAAQQEATAAEGEYTAAFEKGDALAMAKAQRKMANAEARVVRLDEARADLEVQKKTVERAPQRRAASPARTEAAPHDPVDAYVTGRSDASQKWLRAHPDFVTDQRKNHKLTAAHSDALAEGLNADTPEYFEHIESFIGLKQNGRATTRDNGRDTNTTSRDNGAQKRRTAVPVAPVQQSSGGTNGGAREVRLTQGEAKAAQDGTLVWNYDDPSGKKQYRKGDPIGIQEMARRKESLTKQGAYDRSYAEQ